jgi:hypothetical protein
MSFWGEKSRMEGRSTIRGDITPIPSRLATTMWATTILALCRRVATGRREIIDWAA